MESVEIIQWCIDHLNYATITLLMAIESSFIPFPSEVVIPPAAWKAAHNESLNIYLVVLFATIGANIGALINYYLARWFGRPLIYAFANSRWGHMCLIDEAKVQHAESYFERHGAISTFLLFTTLGAGIWNSILAILGYYLSTVPGIETEEQLMTQVSKYSHEIGYAIIAVVAAVILFLIYKGRK